MRKIKKILFIIVTFLFVSINVYACTTDDGCTNCGNQTAETECKKKITIAIYGDSISTYEGYINGIDGDATYMAYYSSRDMSVSETWWARLANIKGWRVIANDSIGSTRVSWDGITTNDIERVGEKYYMAGDYRTSSVGSKGTPNKIFIFAGVNDIYSEDVPIGTVGNAHLKNDAIFANAYYSMLQKLKTKYPKTEITCIAPYIPKYLKDNTELRTNQIDDVIIQLAKNNGVNYVDLRKVNFVNEDFIEGIHPSSSGMEKIANAVAGVVTSSNSNTNICESKCKGIQSSSDYDKCMANCQSSINSGSNSSSSNNVGTQTEKITMKKENKQEANCDTLFGTNTIVGKFLHDIYNIIKFIVPILLLGLSIKDFATAITSQNDNAKKVALITFSKRLIIAILILVVPTLLNLIFNLFEINTCFL